MNCNKDKNIISGDDVKPVLQARSIFYKLFSDFFYDIPEDNSLLDHLFASLNTLEQMLAIRCDDPVLEDAFQVIREELSNRNEIEHKLAREYTSSFLLGGYSVNLSASPYFSPTGAMYQEERSEVKNIYISSGLKLNTNKKIPEDHLALELYYMHYMANRDISVIDDKSKLINSFRSQADFMENNVYPLVYAVAKASEKKGNTGFYMSLLIILREFVKQDTETVNCLISDEEELCLG